MPLLLASTASTTHATLVLIVVGLVIGVVGHLTRSRLLILAGILIIAVVSAYFSFALQPGHG